MTTRRQFLQQSAIVSLAPLIPTFLARAADATAAKADDRVLVVLQLDGGNDGLNTVVPFADPLYEKHRRELRLDAKSLVKLNDSVALHPQLKPAAALWEKGQLAIVQGVGYPNRNRSHFESMAIWHHARVPTAEHDGIGWLGRAGDQLPRPASGAAAAFVGEETLPVALRGRRSASLALQDESDLKLTGPATDVQASQASDVAAFVHRSVAESFYAARRFADSEAGAGATAKYPDSKLGGKLRLVSRLLKLGGGTRVYYVTQTGYDTHAAQAFTHLRLLDELADALVAFLADLEACGIADRVAVLAFSEFGRRVEENASAGTDHGAAGPVFLAGRPVRGGLVGDHPSLANLDDGDLKPAIDFRRVYATVLDQWLGVPPRTCLVSDHQQLPLFA
jgi:uncharacterized protein (DUF1501 family)